MAPSLRFSKTATAAAAHRLYVAAVAQARSLAFYDRLGVPDTLDGRFDMLALHVTLILRRLKRDRARTANLAQDVFDLMFADLDQNLREVGVGDMAMGKRIRALAEAFYGRIAAYDAALDGHDNGALESALQRNVYRGAGPRPDDIATLARYVRSEAGRLDEAAIEDLLNGVCVFGEIPESTGRAS